MSEWRRLYKAHEAVREVDANLLGTLRRPLIELARRRHCDSTIQGRFTLRKGPRLNAPVEYYIHSSAGHEPLVGLAALTDARLTLMAKVDSRRTHLHQFTAMVEGMTPVGLHWASAVHLEDDVGGAGDDRKGSGACGHAVLHCHVGPTLDHEPKVRVPFPALSPAAALDWLLTVVVPDWEPEPW